MADTGAPWNLPYPLPTDLVRDGADAIKDLAEATADGLDAAGGGFTASETITATDPSWPVPTLGSPIVKVTVVGAGGGAGENELGVQELGRNLFSGGAGGSTTFNASTAGSVTALGGLGGAGGNGAGAASRVGLVSGNSGNQRSRSDTRAGAGGTGGGGEIKIAYLDLTGISTVDVTIGAGGAGGGNSSAGGAGQVIVEYEAG